MKKFILAALTTALLLIPSQSTQANTCSLEIDNQNCNAIFSSVTAESVSFCKGKIKITAEKKSSLQILPKEQILFTATNNQTKKSYTSVINGPTITNNDPFVGIISNLPSGTYTVTTLLRNIDSNQNLCSYTCNNIVIPRCPLISQLFCCCN